MHRPASPPSFNGCADGTGALILCADQLVWQSPGFHSCLLTVLTGAPQIKPSQAQQAFATHQVPLPPSQSEDSLLYPGWILLSTSTQQHPAVTRLSVPFCFCGEDQSTALCSEDASARRHRPQTSKQSSKQGACQGGLLAPPAASHTHIHTQATTVLHPWRLQAIPQATPTTGRTVALD
jgi:hypothetical protein